MSRKEGIHVQTHTWRWYQTNPHTAACLMLAAGMVIISATTWPCNATAQGLSHIQNAGAQVGQQAPSQAQKGTGAQPSHPGVGSGSGEKKPQAGAKDKNLGGGNQGPGCPFRNKKLELIV